MRQSGVPVGFRTLRLRSQTLLGRDQHAVYAGTPGIHTAPPAWDADILGLVHCVGLLACGLFPSRP